MKPNLMSEMKARQGGGTSGFAAGQKPSNDNARVASGKFAANARRNSSSAPPPTSMWTEIEFFYMDASDNQIGPASVKEMRAKFKSGEIDKECFFWYEVSLLQSATPARTRKCHNMITNSAPARPTPPHPIPLVRFCPHPPHRV